MSKHSTWKKPLSSSQLPPISNAELAKLADLVSPAPAPAVIEPAPIPLDDSDDEMPDVVVDVSEAAPPDVAPPETPQPAPTSPLAAPAAGVLPPKPAPATVPDEPEPHKCYRCGTADGTPVYCGFCQAYQKGNVNARVVDILKYPVAGASPRKWSRIVHAMLGTFQNPQHSGELSMHIDRNYPLLHAIATAALKD